MLLVREKLRDAGLTREEVIGLRLYTGPLFVRMKGALRGGQHQLYTDTIFAATSGLIKLSKVSPTPEGRLVFRGLSGIELPPAFWDTDAHGVKGSVEMAFPNTTSQREVVDKPQAIEVQGTWYGPENTTTHTHHVWAIPVRINCNVQNFNIENFGK